MSIINLTFDSKGRFCFESEKDYEVALKAVREAVRQSRKMQYDRNRHTALPHGVALLINGDSRTRKDTSTENCLRVISALANRKGERSYCPIDMWLYYNVFDDALEAIGI